MTAANHSRQVLDLTLLAAVIVVSGSVYSREFTPVTEMAPSDWTDSAEIQRTWEKAAVAFRRSDGHVVHTLMERLEAKQIPGNSLPTLIFVHGCAGFWEGTCERIEFLRVAATRLLLPIVWHG